MPTAASPRYSRPTQQGLTLPELIIAIVVIAVGLSGVISAVNFLVARTGQPERLAQATAIAEAYIEEITLHPLVDPDGVGGETARTDFDDVFDYNGLSEPPTSADGVAVPNMAAYTVTVTITNTPNLGPSGSEVPAADAALIQVRVTGGALVDLTLSTVKTRL